MKSKRDFRMLIQYLRKPARFDYLHNWLRKPSIRILDVGCGNHSPSLTKKYYPKCKYYGLDKSKDYNLNEEDFNSVEKFYEVDLSNISNLVMIPNDFFDCLILSHIIEHLENSEDVILHLLNKTKKRGIIYIEFPSSHTVHLPSMKGRGGLNFYDDPTHIRLHNLRDLELLLTKNGCTIIKSGVRHSLKRIILLPIYAIGSLILYGYLSAGVLWDTTGFASYIIALKK